MSDHFSKISSCNEITEWLTPRDERLVRVTGLKPPIDAKTLREEWSVQKSEITNLLSVVKRLIVPETLAGKVEANFGLSSYGDQPTGTIALLFEDQEDWRKCLPVSDNTLAFDRNGARGNASIALCGEAAALAVMAMEFFDECELDFAVQPIRQEKLEQILAA
jgi:hypothetical protein